jgi:hypothetical protein
MGLFGKDGKTKEGVIPAPGSSTESKYKDNSM